MLFNYFVVESPRNYKHVTIEQEPFVDYASLIDDYKHNAKVLQNVASNKKKFVCLNDNLSHKDTKGLGPKKAVLPGSLFGPSRRFPYAQKEL